MFGLFGLSNRLFRGVTNRSYHRLARDFGPGPATATLSLAIGVACYPTATYGDKSVQDEIVRQIKNMVWKPCDSSSACRFTESWLDAGALTTDEMFETVWGLGTEPFLKKLWKLETDPGPSTPVAKEAQ